MKRPERGKARTSGSVPPPAILPSSLQDFTKPSHVGSAFSRLVCAALSAVHSAALAFVAAAAAA